MKRRATYFAVIILLVGFSIYAPPIQASDERMAGSSHTHNTISLFKDKNVESSEETSTQSEGTTSQHKDDNRKRLSPPAYSIKDLKNIERIGLKSSFDSLYDTQLWRGTTREDAALIFNTISQKSLRYPSLTHFTKDILISKQEAQHLEGDLDVQSQNDLFTLRLESLIKMGFFKDAIRLYQYLPKGALHNRMAKAGVHAMLFDGRIAIACIDVNVHKSQFDDVFWLLSEQLCNKAIGLDYDKSIKSKDHKHLVKLLKRKNYRYPPADPETIHGLSFDETSWLFALDAVNFYKLSKNRHELNPQIRALFSMSPRHAIDLRSALLSSLIAEGYRGSADVAVFFAELTNSNAESLPRNNDTRAKALTELAALYTEFNKEKSGEDKKNVLELVVSTLTKHPAEIVIPFSEALIHTPVEVKSADSIRTILHSLLRSNVLITSFWLNNTLFKNHDFSEENSLALTAIALNSENLLNAENLDKLPDIKPFYVKKEQKRKETYEKLDISTILHNYVLLDDYDKTSGLTIIENYVMSSSGFLEPFDKSIRKDYDGKRVLLNIAILSTTPHGTIYPDEVHRMVSSFLAVGLKSEAQGLVRDIVLSLDK